MMNQKRGHRGIDTDDLSRVPLAEKQELKIYVPLAEKQKRVVLSKVLKVLSR